LGFAEFLLQSYRRGEALLRRHPQPFWREFTRCWSVQIGKKQFRLSPDRDEAFRISYELMSRRRENQPSPPVVPLTPTPMLVVEVLDAFLDWCGRNQAARTYEASHPASTSSGS
jgi:hypothetical protein